MQRGSIFRHRNCWYLRFYESDVVDGTVIRKRSCRKLASIEDYPKKRDVLLLAEKILSPINTNQSQPEAALQVVRFIEDIYLPYVQKTLKASTYKDYKKDVYEKHLQVRLGDVRLRDFRTVHAQKILTAVTIGDVGHKTGLRIKSFLSGSFKHAKRLGYIDGENPVRDVAVPGRPVKFRGEVYSLDEIEGMLISLPPASVARTVVALAALTGLRLSEIRGLRWSDFDGSILQIRRRVWRTNVDAPKTEASSESVPVLPLLQKALVSHKTMVKPTSDEAYIFAGERRGAPLNLANLVRRVIMPAFEKSELKPRWKGWHAFRRGLATNLYSMGVSPKVIQAILRHSDIGTTLAYYVAPPDAETRAAVSKIEGMFPFGL